MTGPGPHPAQQPDPAERLLRSIEAVQQAVRRQSGAEKELGPKAERTRARLIAAAREVFAERDYLSTSAQDIADRARREPRRFLPVLQ